MKQYNPRDDDDTQLLTRFEERRDQSAFEELVRRHGPMVMATARRVLGRYEDVEEAFQAAFFALARGAGKLRNKAAVAGWLHKTTLICAKQLQRTNARWKEKRDRIEDQLKQASEQMPTHSTNDPSLGFANKELEAAVDEELSRLPDKLQAAIVLCDLEGLSQKQAGAQLNIAPSTVNDRVVKGRKLLRDRLHRRGVTLTLAGLAACTASSNDSTLAVTPSLITDTSAKATLYAAGKSAAEIGVSNEVLQAANMAFSKISGIKLFWCLCVTLAVTAAVGTALAVAMLQPAPAGTLFFDDFSDRDITDGSPVVWEMGFFSSGRADASSGDLVLVPTEETEQSMGIGIGVGAVLSQDMSVRTQARISRTGGSAYVSARIPEEADRAGGYVAAVGYAPEFGGSILIVGRTDAPGKVDFFEATTGRRVVPLSFDVRRSDAVVQLDVIGNRIQAWAWKAGDEMPDEPQFHTTDAEYRKRGFAAVGLLNTASQESDGKSTSTFRYVHVADIPIHQLPDQP